MIRDHVLGRGCDKVLCHFEKLLLGSQLFLASCPARARRRWSSLQSPGAPGAPAPPGAPGASRPSQAGGSSHAGAGFARPRHAMFPFWCPQAAHAASVRGDN